MQIGLVVVHRSGQPNGSDPIYGPKEDRWNFSFDGEPKYAGDSTSGSNVRSDAFAPIRAEPGGVINAHED